LTPEEFISSGALYPILDVRSPGEYHYAHIPGAISFPLFSDEERALIGTAYKQESRETAVKIGLDYFGPRMRIMINQAESILRTHPNGGENTFLVHCWRGGMRSAGVAWLLDLYGFRVYTLEGGYKAFRNFILQQCEREDYNIQLLGGYTGSGKTQMLLRMREQGESVIDLEGLACHKGSAFGNLGMPDQPTQEMFENLLGMEISELARKNQVIWMEDESQRLGHVNIPHPLLQKMVQAPIQFTDKSFEERLDRITDEYGCHDIEELINATQRIQKRLGGLNTKDTIIYLRQGNLKEAFRILLKYYDKQYDKSILKKTILPSQQNA
jgi:tRNA 2-selenouridine synthase